MRAGNARFDLTPAEGTPFYLLGYRSPLRNSPAEGIHDHIYCNSILIEQDDDYFFLWTADLLELPDKTAEVMKTRLYETFGICRDHIILGVMHDHSSIRDYHIDWPYGRFSQTYYDFLIDTVENSYRTCMENLRDAYIKEGRQIVTGFYSNRNHKGLQADNEIIVVRFYDMNDRPFAAIVNWAVHSTQMGMQNMYLTGDLAGNTCRKLGEKWGYYPVFLNGAAGDCSNRNDRLGKDFDELERETDGLCEAIDAISTDKSVSTGTIRFQTLSHSIAPDQEKYHALLHETIRRIESGEVKPEGGYPPEALIGKCKEQLEEAPYYDLIAFEVIDIGDLRFFVFPGELGSKLGLKLKASTEKTALVAGYSNGFHYYFLAEEDYGQSFETIGNPVPAGEAEKIISKMIQAGRYLENR